MSLIYLPLIGLVGAGCLLSLHDWRKGLWLCILVALVQDPIRKVIPGTPIFITVSFVPIYFCMFLGMSGQRTTLKEFLRAYPGLKVPIVLLSIALFFSFAQTLTYGMRALPLACLGLFSYVACVPAVLLGYKYLRGDWNALDRLLAGFVLLTAIMLIGVPLERYEYQFSLPWLGTIAMNKSWYRWYAAPTSESGGYVRMISGFYRSPEIMGWHAMTMVLFSIYLMLRRNNWILLWGLTATWGMYGVLLSGRRKMFLMILVFVACFVFNFRSWRRMRWWLPAMACLLAVSLAVFYFVDEHYLAAAESGLHSAGATAFSKGLLGPLELAWLVGPFGFGVGTKSQGAQHLSFVPETPLFEGGFERILVEIGIVGTLAALLLVGSALRAAVSSLRRARSRPDSEVVGVALYSLISANLAAFVVTFQIFGDPFVIILIGFIGGIMLSLPRVIAQNLDSSSPAGIAEPVSTPNRPAVVPNAGRWAGAIVLPRNGLARESGRQPALAPQTDQKCQDTSCGF
jgi:hypothetical protein